MTLKVGSCDGFLDGLAVGLKSNTSKTATLNPSKVTGFSGSRLWSAVTEKVVATSLIVSAREEEVEGESEVTRLDLKTSAKKIKNKLLLLL